MAAGVSADAPESAGDESLSPSARATAAAESIIRHIRYGFLAVYHMLRGLLFVAYLLLAMISFWMWAVMLLAGCLLLLVRGVMLVVLWLSGGMPPPAHAPSISAAIERDLKRLWAQRLVAYEAFSRPAARYYLRIQRGLVTFWHWHLLRKVAAAVFVLAFIGVPTLYIIPRPHYVQVTDDNAIHYRTKGGPVVYLVHGLDLFEPAVHREYLNEDAWWLGKINSQGLKSQLQIGKYYRLWVVGIRWYYMPQLFPNIIAATQVDEHGKTLEHPTSRIAAPGEARPAALER